MSEIRYTPNDEPTLGNVIRRQWKTQADFSYSILGNVISIIDLDLGEPIGYERHRERLAQDRVLSSRLYRRLQDHVSRSEHIWDGIQWDGQRVSFFALRETDEERARKRLLERK